MVSPKKFDPSGTMSIQRAFIRDLQARFANLKRALLRLVVDEDAFGLGDGKPSALAPTINKRWRFATAPEKMKQFDSWLNDQIQTGILSEDKSGTGDLTGKRYIESAYKKALMSTYQAVNKSKLKGPAGSSFTGSQAAFVNDTFNSPEAVSKLSLLSTRAYSSLKDISSTMDASMSRILAQGIADGKSPRDLGRQLAKEVDGMSKVRAVRIARTEIVHAHAEAQLDGFEALQVDGIEVMAEWIVVGDKRTCPQCSELSGVVLTVKEARGLLPRHPNCRCAWVPADVGEDTRKQTRSKKGKAEALQKSVLAERPNADPADAFKLSRWAGADRTPVPPPKPLSALPLFAPSAELWGQQPTAVMRWMGKEGWSSADAARVLKEMGVEVADGTVKTQVGAGLKGLRGPAATLTEEQAAILRAKRIGEITPPPIKPPVLPPPPPPLPPIIPPLPPVLPPVVPPPLPPIAPLPKIDAAGTSLARWMGKEQFNFADARRLMDEMGVKISDATLKTQLGAGARGLRGAVATLTEEQAVALRLRRTGIKPLVIRKTKATVTTIAKELPVAPPKSAEKVYTTLNKSNILEQIKANEELENIHKAVVKENSKLEELAAKKEVASAKEKELRNLYYKSLNATRPGGDLRGNADYNDPTVVAARQIWTDAMKEEQTLLTKLQFSHDEVKKAVHKLLELPADERLQVKVTVINRRDGVDYSAKGGPKHSDTAFLKPTQPFKDKVKEAEEFLSKVTRKREQKKYSDGSEVYGRSEMEVAARQLKAGSRAYQLNGGNVVHMAADTHTKVYVHEIVHSMETTLPKGVDHSIAFREARIAAAGTKTVKMKDVFPSHGYDDRETGNEDEFHKYFGKTSSSAHYAGKSYGRDNTEILTMGAQEVFDNPTEFALKDPEYFKFVVGFLRGVF